ncbi:hypothetical protein [Polaromonas sp.]|uniref:hypothetical protein n=1 Tax=Polaromonas sp. TaxID=1869339 RepID=UPI00272F49F3|nr:hypothetical protein [Polaromonas sp.]MDP1742931.1 hypothetical protein [Polaromonas sp.]
MDEEFLAKHDRARIECKVNALKSVNKMDLPKVVAISDDSFSGLGLKTTRYACKVLESLREAHGDKLPHLIGLSLREIWYALFDASGYIALMKAEGAMGDNDYMQKLATAEGYGENEGIAWTLYNQLSELVESKEQATFRDGTPFEERLSLGDILKGAAMYWFVAAANSYRVGDVVGAFDWLSEAQDALFLANGNYMWDEGAKLERESAMANSANAVTAARTALAKAAAQARHTETRNMKADVFDWLDVHMTEFKSMDAAAQAIIKQQPVVFRTARDWVGDWKKLRSAGTP